MNNDLPSWLLLVASLPARPAAARMRLWRGVKALGCGALREGAWLLPAGVADQPLRRLAREVAAAGGVADVLCVQVETPEQEGRFRALFDRSPDYARLLGLVTATGAAEAKVLRSLRRDFAVLAAIDFFPGEAQRQVQAALAALEAALGGEPMAAAGSIRRLDRKDYQARTWATRQHLWVDRMASAWLIHRFIDTQAEFLWLEDVLHCPEAALGFDFDGAAFTHVGSRVSFEVLAASFGLDADRAIARIATVVHALDVGGVPVAEAVGIEAVLAGTRARCADDNALLREAMQVFDSLYAAYNEAPCHE